MNLRLWNNIPLLTFPLPLNFLPTFLNINMWIFANKVESKSVRFSANSTRIRFSVRYYNPAVKLYKKIGTRKETFLNKMKKAKEPPSKKLPMMSCVYTPSHEPTKLTKQIKTLKYVYLISNFLNSFKKSFGATKTSARGDYFNKLENDLKESTSK